MICGQVTSRVNFSPATSATVITTFVVGLRANLGCGARQRDFASGNRLNEARRGEFAFANLVDEARQGEFANAKVAGRGSSDRICKRKSGWTRRARASLQTQKCLDEARQGEFANAKVVGRGALKPVDQRPTPLSKGRPEIPLIPPFPRCDAASAIIRAVTT